jgi:hypothetical protein
MLSKQMKQPMKQAPKKNAKTPPAKPLDRSKDRASVTTMRKKG